MSPTRRLCCLLVAALPVLAGCGGGVYIGIGDDDDDDDFPPDVSLAVSPDAARIGEALRFVAAASDDFRIDRVEFYAVRDDGSSLLLGSDPVAPYQLDAALPATAFDRVQFFARAVDDVGQAAGSASVTVFVVD